MVQGQISITWSKQTCLPATNVKDRPQPRCRYCLRHRLEIHQWHPPHQWRGYMPSSSCSAAMHTQRHPTKTVVVGVVGVVVVLLLAAVAVAVAQDIQNITKLELVDQLAPSSMDHRSTVLLAMGGREHLSLQYNMYLLNKNVLCIYTYYKFIIHGIHSHLGGSMRAAAYHLCLGCPSRLEGIHRILSKTCRGMKPTYITIPFRLGWLGWVPWAFSTTWFWGKAFSSKNSGLHYKHVTTCLKTLFTNNYQQINLVAIHPHLATKIPPTSWWTSSQPSNTLDGLSPSLANWKSSRTMRAPSPT